MIAIWPGDTYLLTETQADAIAMTERYGLPELLPGFTVVGLRGWEDLIVRDAAGQFFTAPSVPLAWEHLQTYDFAPDLKTLRGDDQMRGKIKWYVKHPLLGGDPSSAENILWIPLDQHPEAVRRCNAQYRQIREAERRRMARKLTPGGRISIVFSLTYLAAWLILMHSHNDELQGLCLIIIKVLSFPLGWMTGFFNSSIGPADIVIWTMSHTLFVGNCVILGYGIAGIVGFVRRH